MYILDTSPKAQYDIRRNICNYKSLPTLSILSKSEESEIKI